MGLFILRKEFRSDRLRTSDVSSMLRRGNNRETMLITANTQTFLQVRPIASAMPCWHSFDEKRRLDYVLALAGRCVR